MKRGWLWPVVAIIFSLLTGIGLYIFMRQNQPKVAALSSLSTSPCQQKTGDSAQGIGTPLERIPVKVITAAKGNIEVSLPAFGTVTYTEKCDASHEESGSIIKEVPVLIGDMVKPGQPVAVIDTSILQEELKAKRANLDRVKALLDLAQWKYEAQRQVHAKGGTSLQELEEASATYQSRISELAQAQAEISNLETRLKKAVIRSPIHGIVGKKNYFPGERVPLPSEKGIVTIFRIDQVYVEAEVSEKDLTKLRPGLEVSIYPDAYPRTRYRGLVEQLEPVVKDQSRTVIARIRVKNDNFLLKPGMFTRLEIILEKTAEVVNIPLQALRTSPDKSTEVFVVVDNIAFKKKVEVGITTANLAEIKAGLEPGEIVVVEGGDQLKELSRVVAVSDQAHSMSSIK